MIDKLTSAQIRSIDGYYKCIQHCAITKVKEIATKRASLENKVKRAENNFALAKKKIAEKKFVTNTIILSNTVSILRNQKAKINKLADETSSIKDKELALQKDYILIRKKVDHFKELVAAVELKREEAGLQEIIDTKTTAIAQGNLLVSCTSNSESDLSIGRQIPFSISPTSEKSVQILTIDGSFEGAVRLQFSVATPTSESVSLRTYIGGKIIQDKKQGISSALKERGFKNTEFKE